ncbi:MAG: type II toxin-antitoxin system VapC family toxin [Verrucomicrobiota bacterium]
MIAFDTNLLFHAIHEGSEVHTEARNFVQEHARNTECVMAELVLAELYLLIRNPVLVGSEMSPSKAVSVVQRFRENKSWKLVENASVMSAVWELAGERGFARRRLFDVRLALTLQAHGVRRFATANVKDFEGMGFDDVWNPLDNKA